MLLKRTDGEFYFLILLQALCRVLNLSKINLLMGTFGTHSRFFPNIFFLPMSLENVRGFCFFNMNQTQGYYVYPIFSKF